MLFKTDENLPPDAVVLLRSRGHDAVTVADQGLRGCSDADLVDACRGERRILITLDLGFANLRIHVPESLSGLNILRVDSQGKQAVLEALERLIPALESQRIEGRLWVVHPTGIRIRGGDS